MANVKFLQGTEEAYQALEKKDPNTFYFTEKDLYLGEIKLSNDTDLKTAVATTSANGLMSKDMVTKLNGISTGANKVTVSVASDKLTITTA